MANEINTPHDAFFKHYLGQPALAAAFLRQYLPAEVVNVLELEQLQLEKDSFIDESLRSHFSDLIYRTQTREATPVMISLLFEHKSNPDKWVNFQALRYIVRKWERELQESGFLSPIVVVFVYHGKDGWTATQRFVHLLKGLEEDSSSVAQVLRRYQPDFEGHLVNLSALRDEEIQGEVATRLFTLVLKHIFEPGMGGRLGEILQLAAEVLKQNSGIEMLIALLRYIGRAGIEVKKEEVMQRLAEVLPREGGILMQTMVEEWIEEGKKIGHQAGLIEGRDEGRDEGLIEGRDEGLIEGRDEGRVEGRKETGIQILQQLLRHRFTTIPEAVGEQLQSLNAEQLTRLVDVALTAPSLTDFVTQISR